MYAHKTVDAGPNTEFNILFRRILVVVRRYVCGCDEKSKLRRSSAFFSPYANGREKGRKLIFRDDMIPVLELK